MRNWSFGRIEFQVSTPNSSACEVEGQSVVIGQAHCLNGRPVETVNYCPVTAFILRTNGQAPILLSGEPLMGWKPENGTRLGVIPRRGGADDIRWFEVEPSHVQHFWNAWADEDNPPARTCVSGELYRPDLLVELVIIACRG